MSRTIHQPLPVPGVLVGQAHTWQQKNKRRRFAVLVLAALAALAVMGVPVPAHVFAGTSGSNLCAHGGNATSSSCVNDYQGDTYTGVLGEWHNNNMYLDTAHYNNGYHINQEIWLYTRTDEGQFVEMGLRNGQAVGGDPCGACTAYEVFWADWDSSFNEHPHYIANTTPDGSDHQYAILRRLSDPTTYWDVLYDWTNMGTSTNQNSSTAYEAQVGLEISRASGESVGTWAHADGFDDINLYAYDMNGSPYLWPYRNEYIDQPCSNSDAHGTWPTGSCLYGHAPSASEWQNGKS